MLGFKVEVKSTSVPGSRPRPKNGEAAGKQTPPLPWVLCCRCSLINSIADKSGGLSSSKQEAVNLSYTLSRNIPDGCELSLVL